MIMLPGGGVAGGGGGGGVAVGRHLDWHAVLSSVTGRGRLV